jgi:hypothetical protein
MISAPAVGRHQSEPGVLHHIHDMVVRMGVRRRFFPGFRKEARHPYPLIFPGQFAGFGCWFQEIRYLIHRLYPSFLLLLHSTS